MTQSTINFERAEAEAAARDAGISLVLDNAGDDWKVGAISVFRQMSGEDMTGEGIRLACQEAGVEPHHHNAWGGFVNMLVRDGLLVPTGRYEPMRAKGSHARKTQVYRRS